MTKKRLSDLLKEEVNKTDSTEESAAAAPEDKAAPQAKTEGASKAAKAKTSATKSTATRRPSRRRASAQAASKTTGRTTKTRSGKAAKPSAESEPELPVAEVVAAPEPPMPAAEDIPTPVVEAKASRTVTKTDLEKQVATLEKSLASAQKEKASLEKIVKGLQGDLETQQTRIFELKDTLEQTETRNKATTQELSKLKTELEEAKKTILQLTEANSKAAAEAKTAAESKAIEEKPKYNPRHQGIDIVPRRPLVARSQASLSRQPAEPMMPKDQPNGMLSNDDIGWVD